MSAIPDEIYIGYGYSPYFAHAEFEWSGRFDSEEEAVKELTAALKASEKPGSIYWAIRHPSKQWQVGHWPDKKPVRSSEAWEGGR